MILFELKIVTNKIKQDKNKIRSVTNKIRNDLVQSLVTGPSLSEKKSLNGKDHESSHASSRHKIFKQKRLNTLPNKTKILKIKVLLPHICKHKYWKVHIHKTMATHIAKNF